MIRTYAPADRAACLELFRGNVPRYFATTEEAGFTAFLDRLPGPYLVLTDDTDGAIVACGGWARARALAGAVLTWGIVRADRHGQGLGRQLLEARLAGIDAIGGFRTLEASTSQYTEAFFARFGFVRQSVEKDGFAPGIDRVLMLRHLDRPLPPPLPPRTVVLETPRLVLREATVADAAFIRALVNDPAWLANIGDRNVHTDDDARAYITTKIVAGYRKQGFGFYVMERRDDGMPLGICGVTRRDFLPHADIGYALAAEHRGHGYAFEAARAMLDWARRILPGQQIVAIVSAHNAPSIRLLEKLGMRYLETTGHPPDGAPVDIYG